MLRVASSRRAAALKPTDFDHEISLVDHDAARTPPPDASSPEPAEIARSDTRTRLLDVAEENQEQRDGVHTPKTDGSQTEYANGNAAAADPQTQTQGDQSNGLSRPTIGIQRMF